MRHYVPRLTETLSESMSVYLRVLRTGWPQYLCVFAAVELAAFLSRIGVFGDFAARRSCVVYAALLMTAGLFAVVAALDRAYCVCTGSRDGAPGGLAAVLARTSATVWLKVLIYGVLAFVALLACVAMIVVQDKFLGGTGEKSSAIALVAVGAAVACIAIVIWFVVRWIFAVPLGIIYRKMGSSAMSASSRFVVGRFGGCMVFVVVAWLITAGVNALPLIAGMVVARGHLFGLASLDGEVVRAAVLFLTGLWQDIGFLFFPVAALVFVLRAEDHDLQDFIPVRRALSAGIVLLALGILSLAFCVFCAVAYLSGYCSDDVSRFDRAIEILREKTKSVKHVKRGVYEMPADYKFAESLRIERGEPVVDSPFDLRIGSTEYARQLADRISVERVEAKQPGRGLNTNELCTATVRLSGQYHGLSHVVLTFDGEEKALSSVRLSGGAFFNGARMSLEECRKKARAIAEDMSERLEVPVKSMSGKMSSDVAAKYEIETLKARGKRSDDSRRVAKEYVTFKLGMNTADGVVMYRVDGLIDSETMTGSLQITIKRGFNAD